jgi:hypothetical protein
MPFSHLGSLVKSFFSLNYETTGNDLIQVLKPFCGSFLKLGKLLLRITKEGNKELEK